MIQRGYLEFVAKRPAEWSIGDFFDACEESLKLIGCVWEEEGF